MKKIILFVFFNSILLNTTYSNPVDITTAKKVATNFYFEKISQSTQTRLKSLLAEEIKLKIVHQENIDFSTNLKSTSIPCYYVFNVNDNDGFVIVSADDCTTPVLGYSFTGGYNENQPPAFIEWMDHYKEQITEMKTNNLKSIDITNSDWSKYLKKESIEADVTMDEVPPLLTTTWNQGCYYNEFCPEDEEGPCGHALVGCVATAMGQIMKYWDYPNSCDSIPGYTF